VKNVTLCYIEKEGKYLMLHRTKKKNDLNEGKWIGVGGKFEENESPEECVKREVKEDTGLILKECNLRGIVTYISNKWETEYMYLFTSDSFEGELIECNEGELKWIDKQEVNNLNIWEGDKMFLDRIKVKNPFFTLKLEYNGDNLIKSELKEY